MTRVLRDLWTHPVGKLAVVTLGLVLAYVAFRVTLPLWSGVLWLLRTTMPVWSTFLLSVLFAYLLHPVNVWLEERGVPRGVGVALMLVALVASLAGLWLLGLTIAADLSAIVREVPGLVEGLRELPFLLARFVDSGYGDVFDQVFATAHAVTQSILQNVLPSLEGIDSANVSGRASALFGGGLQLSMIFALTIFFLLRFQTYMDSFGAIVPARHRDEVAKVAQELGWAVGGYIRGQLFIAFVVGVLTFLGLWLIGVPLARALGVLAGLLNVIPFFGPILVSIPTVLVALTVGWPHAIGAIVVLVVVNQLDAQVLSPIVFSHTVEIDPATILLSIFLGTVLFGLLGAVLAVPAAVMFRYFLRRAYFESSWYRRNQSSADADAG